MPLTDFQAGIFKVIAANCVLKKKDGRWRLVELYLGAVS
jgi:hypothetical protein